MPEGGKPVRFTGLQGQHGVVVDARFLDVRELRQEEAEVHGIAPSVGLTHSLEASRPGVPAHHAHGPEFLLASFRQREGKAAYGTYGTTVRVWHGVLLYRCYAQSGAGTARARANAAARRARDMNAMRARGIAAFV